MVSPSGGLGPYMSFISTAPKTAAGAAMPSQDATGAAPAASTAASPAAAVGANSAPAPALSGRTSAPELIQLMISVVGLMSQMITLISGAASGSSPFAGALSNAAPGASDATPSSGSPTTSGPSANCPSQGGASPATGSTAPANGTSASGSGSGSTPDTNPVTNPANTPTTSPVTGPVANDGTQPLNMFTASDYKNFLLAGSHGGQTGTAESIMSAFADPGSRFAQTGNDPFQAAVAGMYANQFKGYALGADVAYTPGKDINKIASDLAQVQQVKMTPEAEMLSKVAALYRGNLTGSNLYNNAKLKALLQSWGRNDIASQPNVGSQNGDVQSIGGVVKALNEEKDPAIRQAWLQQVFDFAGNTPSSPSGAVPNLPQYQQAIDLVRSGKFNSLLQAYVQTPGT